MPQIRHLALLTDDQEGLATFYKSVFEMQEVHRHPSPHGGPAIYLSDGHLNLAILPAAGRRKGIFHFGMAVDDVEKTAASAIAAGATPPNETLPPTGASRDVHLRSGRHARRHLARLEALTRVAQTRRKFDRSTPQPPRLPPVRIRRAICSNAASPSSMHPNATCKHSSISIWRRPARAPTSRRHAIVPVRRSHRSTASDRRQGYHRNRGHADRHGFAALRGLPKRSRRGERGRAARSRRRYRRQNGHDRIRRDGAGQNAQPWDLARTPGGSSSGSAAAVGSGMLCAGLGTQVIGSILRPASYCGCVGYKPTVGGINRGGSVDFHSQSTHGVLAASLEDAWHVAREITARAGGDPGYPGIRGPRSMPPSRTPKTLALLETPGWALATDDAKNQLHAALDALRKAGVTILDRTNSAPVAGVEATLPERVRSRCALTCGSFAGRSTRSHATWIVQS